MEGAGRSGLSHDPVASWEPAPTTGGLVGAGSQLPPRSGPDSILPASPPVPTRSGPDSNLPRLVSPSPTVGRGGRGVRAIHVAPIPANPRNGASPARNPNRVV